jgi:hypothetical protein
LAIRAELLLRFPFLQHGKAAHRPAAAVAAGADVIADSASCIVPVDLPDATPGVTLVPWRLFPNGMLDCIFPACTSRIHFCSCTIAFSFVPSFLHVLVFATFIYSFVRLHLVTRGMRCFDSR